MSAGSASPTILWLYDIAETVDKIVEEAYLAEKRCVMKPARLVRDTGKNLVSGQTDDTYWRNMLTLRLYEARVVGANDALMSCCSKPAIPVALVGPGLWLEWGRARGLSVWVSRTANEKYGLL